MIIGIGADLADITRIGKTLDRFGERFAPPQLLVEMAGKDERFYTRFAPAAAA